MKSFAGSIQMIFFSMLTFKIGSQGGPDKMAPANFLWLHFLNNRRTIQSWPTYVNISYDPEPITNSFLSIADYKSGHFTFDFVSGQQRQ